jgi:hypothetical protein
MDGVGVGVAEGRGGVGEGEELGVLLPPPTLGAIAPKYVMRSAVALSVFPRVLPLQVSLRDSTTSPVVESLTLAMRTWSSSAVSP